jgi:predicted Zn-dependent protease
MIGEPYTGWSGCGLRIPMFLAIFLSVLLRPALAAGQSGVPEAASLAKQGTAMAERGRCSEALPILKKVTPRLVDKQQKYQVVMATARCAMSVDDSGTAVEALLLLKREFPHDPEVLYTITHLYSELASRASQELAATAPNSPQAQMLEAEAFESQGNWERATAQYKRILESNPRLSGIHYRLGRILLAKTPPDPAAAQAEFEQELKIDPGNASAEFMLGEIARQAGQWDDAAGYFLRASKSDEGFAEAYLALGVSLNAGGKFSDAIAPLKSYVKMQPADPAGHYQLATAYARTGHKAEAEREMALQRRVEGKSPEQ